MIGRSIVGLAMMLLATTAVPSAGNSTDKFNTLFRAELLKEACQKGGGGNNTHTGICMGFIAAVYDNAMTQQLLCRTEGLTLGQVVAVVTKYFDDHPDRGQYTAVSVVQDALEQVWGCG